MEKGLLITIEGSDGSGKHTQTELLCQTLRERNLSVKQLSFPCYDSQSSALVKMYLGGEFGAHPEDVNPYAASTFYAVDRFASFRKDWEPFYRDGGIVISDRYTVSNAIHQGAKLEGCEKAAYLDWLFDFEYRKIGIPAPDLVLYLDVPPAVSARLRAEREQRTNTKPDIHEQDLAYLEKCRISSLEIAKLYSWVVIDCMDGDTLKSPGDVHREILRTVELVTGIF